mgnify:CR=1 FL=1
MPNVYLPPVYCQLEWAVTKQLEMANWEKDRDFQPEIKFKLNWTKTVS